MCEKAVLRSADVPLTTGITWVTPSPLSMTVPVSVLSPTCLDVQEAASARTALGGGTEKTASM